MPEEIVDPNATDKSQGWIERHSNPSGLPDEKRVPQPVTAEHHEVTQ
jgi:hypothetical protein